MDIYSPKNIYYIYQYVRKIDSQHGKAGTPYYVGKGKNNRINERHFAMPADKDRRQIIFENLSEQEAFDLEKELIAKYGRIDIGTGILRNLTNGGEGLSGRKHTAETKAKIGKASSNTAKRKLIGKSYDEIHGNEKAQEIKQKMSNSSKGKPKPEGFGQKVSESNRRRIISQESKNKIASSLRKYHRCRKLFIK